MKKLILTILTTITILGVNAQGNNLQFNRALFEDYTVQAPSGSDYHIISNAFTIPAGKVWKVTSLSASITGPNQYIAGDVGISKSSVQKYSVSRSIGVGNTSEMVLWIPEGSYDIRVYSADAGWYNVILSGLEFNIVP